MHTLGSFDTRHLLHAYRLYGPHNIIHFYTHCVFLCYSHAYSMWTLNMVQVFAQSAFTALRVVIFGSCLQSIGFYNYYNCPCVTNFMKSLVVKGSIISLTREMELSDASCACACVCYRSCDVATLIRVYYSLFMILILHPTCDTHTLPPAAAPCNTHCRYTHTRRC